LGGFSQGACLTLEYAARHAHRYGGVVGLSGGLIGPEGVVRVDAGSLAGTPVFLGCAVGDPYIPVPQVEQAALVLRRLGADVTLHLYPDMGHLVSEEELTVVRGMLQALGAR
jgi:predicted esterase